MKINKLIHIVLAINIGVLCFALMACSSSKMNLVDEYYIYSPDEFHETYYLKCKLSGDRDHVEKPLNFDPFGHARFAHLFVLYD